ncbi:uncharacterized protein LOC794385 [Danio rerio]|uniref:Si:dkey-75a21.2 n=1 Tax=Danio rerio TaxID=7955 RepID=B0UYE1_DANRE|nr:uncharacterized protein LOC794385 [Danio rerio]|eukprot:NP_001116781.1 uncharacterized protein LOC794385 [Danio rerio]
MKIIKCRFCMGEERAAEDTDHVEKILPPGYSHLLCRHELLEKLEDMENFRASLKLQMTSEEQVQKWLEDFQKTSALTWRKSRTYPDSGRYNKYRVDLRCHHKTYSASSKTSKNTNCPATMFLILKRSMHERKSRSGDPHIEEGYFLHVNLRNEHNHRLHTAEVMRWRDVSNDTIEKLQQLYKSGHSPSSALKTIKYNLQEEEGDNYLYAITDRSICPDIQFCYRLYYKLFPKSFAEPAEKDISEELFRPLELEQSWETMTVTDGQATFNEETVSVTTVPIITTTEAEHFTQEPVQEPGPSTAVAETVGTLDGQLEDVFGILKKKLNEDASFTPSIRAFVSNFYQLKNDSALQSSLFCFGKVAEIISQISVQPAAGPRKKGAGRRAVGRPPKNSRREHPYCNSRTEDAPPTLTFCLQETNTLEKTDEPQTAASGGCTDPITVALQGTLETNS